ncbi:MAG: hypothetical protein ACREV0_07560 [Burkholderiales bacterium]
MASVLPQRVSDARGNRNELVEHAVRTIGRSAPRRAVFEAVYFHKSRIKSADEIAKMIGLPRMRVLQEANALAHQQLIGKVIRKGELIAYEQDPIYQANKREILRQLDDKVRRDAFPTKRNPRTNVTVDISSRARGAVARFVTIDEIASFAKVKHIAAIVAPKVVSEAQFKKGLQKIISEQGRFTDWGGEQNDLFTTWLKMGPKRRRAAFVLKGPGAKGKMTLRQLGKNADQIQRLFKSPAEVFFVQYHGEIDQMVVTEMETYARDLARKEEKSIWFGIIDGQDSRRLIAAYPAAFQ